MQRIGNGFSPTAPSLKSEWANNDDRPAPAPFRVYMGATVFCFFSAGLWLIWAISMINTVFIDGFPQLGTMPSYGNVFPYGYLTILYGYVEVFLVTYHLC